MHLADESDDIAGLYDGAGADSWCNTSYLAVSRDKSRMLNRHRVRTMIEFSTGPFDHDAVRHRDDWRTQRSDQVTSCVFPPLLTVRAESTAAKLVTLNRVEW